MTKDIDIIKNIEETYRKILIDNDYGINSIDLGYDAWRCVNMEGCINE